MELALPKPATDNTTYTILVNGTALPASVGILSIDISRSVNTIASATIVCYDGDVAKQDFELSNRDDLVPGTEIEIQGGYGTDEDSLFKGIITRHQIRVRRRGEDLLVIECRDAAYRMTLSRKSAFFREMTDGDVFEQIIGAAGLSPAVAATTIRHPQIVQYQMSDWDFMMQRAERIGLVCRTDDGTVTIEDPLAATPSPVQIGYGTDVFDADLEIDGRLQPATIEARSWDHADQAVLSADASSSSAVTPGNIDASTLADDVGETRATLRHGGAVAQDELDAWVNGSLTKARLTKVRGTVSIQGTRDVVPGTLVDLSGLGERFSGPAYVSGAQHRFAGGDWRTTLQIGLDPKWHYEKYPIHAVPGDGLGASISGLQIGVVTEIVDPAGEARIRVRLPLIDEDEGVWARIARVDAGAERGIVFNPEVDDEVVVGFIDEDPNHPVVLGMLHSSAKAPPIEATEDNFVKGFVTREKLELRFDDEGPAITILTPNGNTVVLSDAEGSIVVEDETGNKVTLSDSGITVESAADLEIKASGDIKIQGTNIELSASAGLKLEGSGQAKLSSGGTTEVKGSMVQIN